MKIIRQKLFHKKNKFTQVSEYSEGYNHYTIPENIIKINKSGKIYYNPTKTTNKWNAGLSSFERKDDKLIGENFNKLNDLANSSASSIEELDKFTKSDRFKNYIKNDSRVNTESINNSINHVKKHGMDSYVFATNDRLTGVNLKEYDSALNRYMVMDGLIHPHEYDSAGISMRRTRTPIRIIIPKDNELQVAEGTDFGEKVISNGTSEGISTKNIKYEIPESGVGYRDRDFKRMKKYLKSHKNKVNPTKETVAALYGTKYPGLSKYKSEIELLKKLKK